MRRMEQPRKVDADARSLSCSICCRIVTRSVYLVGEQFTRRCARYPTAAIGEEAMRDDLRLLLESVVRERLSGRQLISVAAERMPHQRQIEAALRLRLPDVRHFMDEEALAAE